MFLFFISINLNYKAYNMPAKHSQLRLLMSVDYVIGFILKNANYSMQCMLCILWNRCLGLLILIMRRGKVSFLWKSACIWVAVFVYLTQWSSPTRSLDLKTGSRSPRSSWERPHRWTERCPEGLPFPRWSPGTEHCPAGTGGCSASPCLPCWRTAAERQSHIGLWSRGAQPHGDINIFIVYSFCTCCIWSLAHWPLLGHETPCFSTGS